MTTDQLIERISRLQLDFDRLIEESNEITHLDCAGLDNGCTCDDCTWQIEECLGGRR